MILWDGKFSITSTHTPGCPHGRYSYESYYCHISPFTQTNDEIKEHSNLRNAYCAYASRMAAQSKHVQERSKYSTLPRPHSISWSNPRVLIEERWHRTPKRAKRGWRLRRAIHVRAPHCYSRIRTREQRVGPHVCWDGTDVHTRFCLVVLDDDDGGNWLGGVGVAGS
jgi:hypothetical protein